MIKILAFITTVIGIATGIKTGLTSFGNMDDSNKNLVSLTITCIVHCFFWSIIYTLPVYLLQKFWWIAVIVIVVGIIIYILKMKKREE